MVLGTSGSGKTRLYLKPNMMESAQKNVFSGMVITDPKKELCIETADMMKKHGYNIKIFDVKDFSGDCWNPFNYFYNQTDVISFVKSLMINTDGEKKGGEAFWDNASMFLFNAIIFYLIEKCPPSDRNLVNVKRLIKLAIVEEEEDGPGYKSPLDSLFDDLEKENPKSLALDNYRSFKLAGNKTLKSIIISCAARLYFIGIEEIDNMLKKDEIEIEKIGYEKTVLYIVISDTDSTYNFLAGMFIDQLFKVLIHKADKTRKKPFIHFFLDEFANIGKLNYFCEKLSTIRSRNISATVILQNLQQLEKLYEKQDKSIIENCNTKLVLATSESAKWVSEKLGAMTIETKTGSKSKGRNKSSSTNEGQMKRNLLDPNEVEQLDKTKCIIMTQGNYPILATKYDITKHKLYKELGDVNEDSKNNYEHVKEKKQFEKLTFEDLIESANLEIDGAINELEEEYESLI
jgi:type IV secretion system protein VirD4